MNAQTAEREKKKVVESKLRWLQPQLFCACQSSYMISHKEQWKGEYLVTRWKEKRTTNGTSNE